MQTVLIIVHLIIVLALVGVVLLQRSEGGGLGLGGGGGGGVSGFLTGRGQANALTRATAILAGLFFLTSLVLSILAGYSRAPRSILDNAGPLTVPQAGQPGAPAGGGGGVLDELRRLQGGGSDAPAAPPPGAPTVPFQAPVTPGGAPQVPQSR